ncbi:MAG: single-stranded DNA-binding protein [Spirochaetes bacterium]|nr:single-stranded DNA-binding protein [Spirochaetota bacterium]
MTNVTIEGFVTHDPVVKKTKSGKNLCDFSVAVNHSSSGDNEPKVSFFDVETWEGVAEFSSANIRRGSKVIVFGSLRQDRWENTEGKIRSKVKIIANSVRYFENHASEKTNEKVAASA